MSVNEQSYTAIKNNKNLTNNHLLLLAIHLHFLWHDRSEVLLYHKTMGAGKKDDGAHRQFVRNYRERYSAHLIGILEQQFSPYL